VPHQINAVEEEGWPPAMMAAIEGRADVMEHLARLGADLSLANFSGDTVLDHAVQQGHSGTVRLLEDIASAGGWPQYMAARRMAYVRIRHEVSATYRILPGSNKLYKIMHFVFGRNKMGEAVKRTRRAGMVTIPDDLFALVCRFLVS